MPNLRQWNEGGHAIVKATFAVIFASSPTPQTIRELLALHSKIKENYPRRKESMDRMIGFRADTVEDEEFHPEVGEAVLAGFTLDSLKADGLSANTLNRHRQDIAAFANWCVKNGRLGTHPFLSVPKQDVTRDRRRQRTG